ncbi:MAG: adenylosuccinate synthetase [Patescibacteria group bacterium]|nr:adenylosuccinate synthetase [Patescibacteria group bacterium]
MPEHLNQKLENIFKPYKTIVVAGGNWGDEGKGKIIDLVMEHYDLAVRYSGGANAGHTVKTPQGVKLVSHLIPCGLAQHKTCVMGRGEFFDARLFSEELAAAKQALGGGLPEIFIDHMSPLWTPWHSLLEGWLELSRGNTKVGTTGKGIGPLEGIYKLRVSPVAGHLLLEKEELVTVLKMLYGVMLPILEKVRGNIPAPESVAEELLSFLPQIGGRITDTSFVLHQALQNGKSLLFEGAQALGLDSHWGTYPFVSSGNSAAAGAAIGAGLPMQSFAATLMVVKTLPTRVGSGPFPSEMWEREEAMFFAKNHSELFGEGAGRAEFLSSMLKKINQKQATAPEMSQYFQVLGDERGATTGRGRSVGFTDIPWLQYACRINGPKWLALTRFDMLSGVKSIPVIVGYKYQGRLLQPGQLPPPWEMSKVETIKEDWPCWTEDISGVSEEKDLPQGAREFLSRLEKAVGVPILLVGTGPGREAAVVRGVA